MADFIGYQSCRSDVKTIGDYRIKIKDMQIVQIQSVYPFLALCCMCRFRNCKAGRWSALAVTVKEHAAVCTCDIRCGKVFARIFVSDDRFIYVLHRIERYLP